MYEDVFRMIVLSAAPEKKFRSGSYLQQRFKRSKGEMMGKQHLRILIALIGVAASGIAVKGQAIDRLVVKVPYEFVVDGKILPAGTYKVDRASGIDDWVLIFSNLEKSTSLIVTPSTVDSKASEQASVSFERIGGQLFLSKIETADHAFTIPVSRAEIIEASAQSQGGTSAAGGSAGSH
jgi:hypothetical protein